MGRINGWDFSNVRCISAGVKWDFFEEVKRQCRPEDKLLDIGTGGGEKLLSLSPAASICIGIDLSAEMIKQANKNKQEAEVENIQFIQMSADALQFPNKSFDVVTSRHAPFDPSEIARVLKDGGKFLTQQVSENDKRNIIQFFNPEKSVQKEDGTLQKQYVDALKKAGFSKVTVDEYDAIEFYERPEDLVFLLKHTPIIPHFGENPADYDTLNDFIKHYTKPEGIETNAKRFMIIAQK